ncbi:MAG TPA: glycosyltransferase [Salinimicrobium sp.]|nr:glycosyltransferase [Salinimicrobium sp.]
MSILAIVFLAITAINIGYYISFFSFSFSKISSDSKLVNIPVSIVICAKNEAENLRDFLPLILSQEYSDFEVILINDASNDETLEVMEDFQAKNEKIKIVNVENNEAFWANKKYALTLGIKKAKHKYLLFTDADCRPESSNWIKEMVLNFAENKSIVLGYGGYFHGKNFLNKLIRFETLLTAIQYFSFARLGNPYMGVGRNLAYTSDEFYAHNGFASHLYIRSGDDDLFVNQAASGSNTAICFSHGSITRSYPKKTFGEWFTQKRRHVSVAKNYKKKDQFLLALFYASQLLFWLSFILVVIFADWKIALCGLAVRLLIQFLVYFGAGKKLNERDIVWIFPFLELFLVSFQLVIFISNLMSKPQHWK